MRCIFRPEIERGLVVLCSGRQVIEKAQVSTVVQHCIVTPKTSYRDRHQRNLFRYQIHKYGFSKSEIFHLNLFCSDLIFNKIKTIDATV